MHKTAARGRVLHLTGFAAKSEAALQKLTAWRQSLCFPVNFRAGSA